MTTAGPTSASAAEVHHFVILAQRQHSAGRLAEAAAFYRKILAIKPDIAEAYNDLGNVLRDQGKLAEAAAQYERAADLNPDFFHAHNNLGCMLRQQGKLDQAAARFERALALAPNFAEAHNNLGNVLKDQGKLDLAAAQYERAAALDPSLFKPHNNLGCILLEQGKLDQAEMHYEQALALAPDLAEVHVNVGIIRKQQGKFDEAAARFDQALALRPDSAESHHLRTDLKTFRRGDADLATLEALAADNRLPPGKMLLVHFALGKALEDVGEYGRAFEHLLQGNALKRREVLYDEAACQQSFRLNADLFDGGLLERFQGAGDPSPAPIFVLGMPRSGSTLVEQILASHPQIHAAGELNLLDRVALSASGPDALPVPVPTAIATQGADGLRRLGQAYLAGLPTPPDGKTRITDKAPGNFFHVGLIRLILPGARIIHTTRDPVDTCVSCFSKLFIGLPYTYDLAELGGYYRWYHEMMEHWRSILPAGAMLDVAYEAVVDNLEEQARRLIDYCGLPWDDRCLSFHETNRPIATPSNVQVRQPLYRRSLARWRRYEAYLEPLLAELESCRQSE